MKITGNEPANPIVNSQGYCTPLELVLEPDFGSIGLTIRQQFAIAAMQGVLASKNFSNIKDLTKESVIIADELIKALNETPNPNL